MIKPGGLHDFFASRTVEPLLQVIEDAGAVANILVTVFKHDVDLAGGASSPNEIDQVGKAPSEAGAILAIEYHLLRDRRRPILLHEPIVWQRAGQPHGEIVADERHEIIDQRRRLFLLPAGELPLRP